MSAWPFPGRALRLVIFDCDGVLIDSEAIANRLLAEEMTGFGWPLDTASATERFIGRQLGDIPALLRAETGRDVPEGWLDDIAARLVARLGAEADPVPGAEAVLRATSALGLPWRIASNSSHAELAAKFARAGFATLVEGRVHSASDVARGKPAPDLFLAAAAAAAAGVAPEHCLVVEDSRVGVLAARAAGMACIGFDPHGDGAALAALGARPLRRLADLPALLEASVAPVPT